jgi:hypothetical protein
MNRSVLIALCVAGALAFACGPRAQTNASTALRTVFRQSRSVVAPAAQTPTRAKSTDHHEQTLSAQFDVTAQPEEVLFVLNVTNEQGKRVEVNFGDGQLHDFVVVDAAGRQVWRWAEGRIFTQTIQNKLLGRGQSMRISARWRGARPGHYTAVARLRSSNYPLEQRVEFDAR